MGQVINFIKMIFFLALAGLLVGMIWFAENWGARVLFFVLLIVVIIIVSGIIRKPDW